MTRSTTLDLIATLARDELALRGQEFLAPLVGGGRARIRVRGIAHTLRVIGARPGWWVCRARDAHTADLVEEAQPWQRGDYLALLRPLRLVLVEARPAAPGAQWRDWIALPFNPAEALRRFGLRGPVALRLVEGGQPFERVVGRVEGADVWYDEPDRRADPATAEALRAALDAGQGDPRVPGLAPGEQAAFALLAGRREAARAATEAERTQGRLRHALTIGGARLIGYEHAEGALRVTWERDGQRSVALVGEDLGVIAAGVCLQGQDHRFDLASVVGVVRDAPDYARYDDEG